MTERPQDVTQTGLPSKRIGRQPGTAAAESTRQTDAADIDDDVLGELLEQLPADARVVVQGIIAKRHSGPLPDPQTFREYEAVYPGAAEEILAGARENRHHRIDMDRRLAGTARLSLILTWALVAGFLVAAVVLGLAGHDLLAGIFGVGGLAPVLVAMMRGGGTWRGQ